MRKLFSLLLMLPLLVLQLAAQTITLDGQQAEKLSRGVVAMKTGDGVFVSWRVLGTDSEKVAFNVLRDGTKVNGDKPISTRSNWLDKGGTATSKYSVEILADGATVSETTAQVETWANPYLKIPLDKPADGSNNSSYPGKYSPNDASVGDVDGDGEYEIILKWNPSNSADNSQRWKTDKVYLDCYKLNGTKLWRIDLGQNIRSGAHYTQFMVYDLDGDGKAEVACKTAPGTKDGTGKNVIMGSDDPTKNYQNSSGIIISGPEYLTVFNGETGAEITTVAYEPSRDIQAHSSSGWGDNYGNRCERYLACIAYLDGKTPSLVMCRGYYTYAYITAYKFDGTKLTKQWMYTSPKSKELYGEGAHSLAVGDINGDGCDDIIYGAAALDGKKGTALYRTGSGHGDALHLGDLDPENDGLEVFMVHEEKSLSTKMDYELRDKNGKYLWALKQSGNDIGRGCAADIDSNYYGHEMWPQKDYSVKDGKNSVFDCKGNVISTSRPSVNFRIYWDGDLLDELLDGSGDYVAKDQLNPVNGDKDADKYIIFRQAYIQKWNCNSKKASTLLNFNSKYGINAVMCNTTKSTPCLSGDILGDWREEVVLMDDKFDALYIFSTTYQSHYKIPTLMHDHIYRMSIAWQNVAYNQPPHLGYYLWDRYTRQPKIKNVNGAPQSVTAWVGDAFSPVEFMVQNASGLEAKNLPAGMTLTKDEASGIYTLGGSIPSEPGTYSVTLTTTGTDSPISTSVTITVRKPSEFELVAHYPAYNTGAESMANEVFGQAVRYTDGTTFRQSSYDKVNNWGAAGLSIEMFIKSSMPTDADAYLFQKGSVTNGITYTDASGNTATGTGRWIGIEYKKGNLYFAIDDDVTKTQLSYTNGSEFFDGNWHHIACVRDQADGNLKLYKDGVLIVTQPDASADVSQTEDIVIGNCNMNFNNQYVGEIRDLKLYNGTLPENAIKETAANKPTPLSHVTVAEGAGITVNYVNHTITVECDAEVLAEIYDIQGRLVASKRISGSGVLQGRKGISVLRVINSHGEVIASQKIVL